MNMMSCVDTEIQILNEEMIVAVLVAITTSLVGHYKLVISLKEPAQDGVSERSLRLLRTLVLLLNINIFNQEKNEIAVFTGTL